MRQYFAKEGSEVDELVVQTDPDDHESDISISQYTGGEGLLLKNVDYIHTDCIDNLITALFRAKELWG